VDDFFLLFFFENKIERAESPVLKHGSRSSTCLRKKALKGLTIYKMLTDILKPERWWIIPGDYEERRNSFGGSMSYWRANHLLELGIGAKDLSNYLVAGFFW